MHTSRLVAKNTFFLMSSVLIQKFLTFILVILIARFLGVKNFGTFSFVFSFVIMFTTFTDFGINSFIIREIAKSKQNVKKLLGNSLALKALLSFFTVLIIVLTATLLGYNNYIVFLLFLAAISMVLDSIAGLLRALFFAFERMHFELITNTAYKSLIFILSIFVLFLGFKVTALVIANLIASILNFLLSLVIVSTKFVRPSISVNLGFWKKLLKKSLPFCFVIVFLSIYSNIDMSMLHFFKGSKAVGFYSAAVRLINTFALIHVGFVEAVFPTMTRFFAQKNDSLKFVVRKSTQYLFMISFPLIVLLFFLSNEIISLIYSSSYLESAKILQILVFFSFFSFQTFFLTKLLQSTGQEKISALFVALTLSVNVVANFLLIPVYTYIGAAIATVISEGTLFVISYIFISKKFFNPINFSRLFLIIASTGLMALLLIILINFLNTILAFIISIFFYISLIYFLVLKVEDKRLISQLLKNI
jgi:O-antigen/teichoic acid export membrane protein